LTVVLVVVEALDSEDLFVREEDPAMAAEPEHLARLLQPFRLVLIGEQLGLPELVRLVSELLLDNLAHGEIADPKPFGHRPHRPL
jgi:hypothetical protein